MDTLFKGKQKYTDNWVYGDLIHTGTKSDNNLAIHMLSGRGNYEKYLIDENTVCMNSKLKDINSNEIYDHDIIKVMDKPNSEEYTVMDIKYTSAAFYAIEFYKVYNEIRIEIYNKNLRLLSELIREYNVEIIGNLFDNKEIEKIDLYTSSDVKNTYYTFSLPDSNNDELKISILYKMYETLNDFSCDIIKWDERNSYNSIQFKQKYKSEADAIKDLSNWAFSEWIATGSYNGNYIKVRCDSEDFCHITCPNGHDNKVSKILTIIKEYIINKQVK